MEFKEGLEADFYGVDNNTFKLGRYVYEVLEDDNDGYRSAMEDVCMKDDTNGLIFFNQPVARVRVEVASEADSRYGTCLFEGYKLVDVKDGHVWLLFGTDNADDYYPSFTFEYQCKNEYVLRMFES